MQRASDAADVIVRSKNTSNLKKNLNSRAVIRQKLRDRTSYKLKAAKYDAIFGKNSSKVKSTVSLQKNLKEATLIVARVFECKKCRANHVTPASGFFIDSSGILVTSYHVIDPFPANQQKETLDEDCRSQDIESDVLLVLDEKGDAWQITDVLVGSRAYDLAVLQVSREPINLKENMMKTTSFPVVNLPNFNSKTEFLAKFKQGTDVGALGHPNGYFFTLTAGKIARYYERIDFYEEDNQKNIKKNKRNPIVGMSFTADIAKGCSGCPVFDQKTFQVIGVADSTRSIHYDRDSKTGLATNFQMNIRTAVPIWYLKALFTRDDEPPAKVNFIRKNSYKNI